MHAGYKPEQRDLLEEERINNLLFRSLIHLGLDHLIKLRLMQLNKHLQEYSLVNGDAFIG